MTTNDGGPSRFKLRGTTLSFLTATAVLTAAAFFVGVADNLPGVLLLYSAGLTLVLAVTHRWKNPKNYGFLLLAAVLGFFFMVVLHNFAEVGAERIPDMPVLAFLLTSVSVIGFILALFVCPMAGIVGFFGWVATIGKKSNGGGENQATV